MKIAILVVLYSVLTWARAQSNCKDSHTDCTQIKDKCTVWKEYMIANCKKTCNYCHICQDADNSFCKKWKHKCKEWGSYMETRCSKTCGYCTAPTKPSLPPTKPSLPTCGIKGRSHARIVGGDIASPGDWPWQVTYDIEGNSGNPGHWCGASIIAPNWIVTAAHCFGITQDPSKYQLTVGDFEIGKHEGYEQKMQIEKIITHERYDSDTYDFDIALIKLRNTITYTERVKPICLPPDGLDFSVGTECYVTGWGKLDENGAFPKRLYQAKVPLVDRQVCDATYQLHHGYRITEQMRCAGFTQGKIDACQGDSGGPLVCQKDNRWYLMGAVSWGVGCAQANAYGVYADLAVLGSWVQNTMKNS